MERIYFDISATTPVDPQVTDFMYKLQKKYYGNPSSIHREGQSTKVIIEKSRNQLAKTLNCQSDEIIFTSSGSESNNMVLKGSLERGDHFITSSYEHPAILQVIPSLQKMGVKVSNIEPNSDGIIQLESIKEKLQKNTKLISIMYVNNEIGTINPIHEIATFCYDKKILFHSDGVQALGKIPLDMKNIPVNFLSMSAHKLYGPKGVGALFIKKGSSINPLIHGGGQESNLRGSTENIIGIGGFGLAAELATKNIIESSNYIDGLGIHLVNRLNKNNIVHKINGKNCVPGVFNITFPLIKGQDLVMQLDIAGIAISFGSACASGTVKASSILINMGLTNEEALSTVRISMGKIHSKEDVETVIDTIGNSINTYMEKNN